ncbi:MAG TPA: hypothetical protein VGD61_27450 [Pyrinomonadaceae bacterium]
MGVLDDAFKEATKSLDFTKREDRLTAGYFRRRGAKLLKQKPSMQALDLALQLKKEQAKVVSYITQKFLDLIKGPDPKTPSHLDLETMANVGDSSVSKKTLEKTYVTNRSDWIRQIVWRAVTIHDDLLWKKTEAELETEALDELFDRRVHTVEQLYCNVNSGGIQISPLGRTWKVSGPAGPWTDGILVRNFEYPFLPKDPFKDHLSKMKNWVEAGKTILFSPSGTTGAFSQANVRFPKRINKAWLVLLTQDTFTKWITFQPQEGLKHDDVFREMFSKPRENYFDRNWLYCDQTGSSLNIKGLELGIARRPGAPHTDFETAMTTEGYVRLGPVVRAHPKEKNEGFLMNDDSDLFFENIFIDINDLQVGDFVCFWNNHLYDLIAAGAWRNEYSHVMDVDTDINGNVKVATDGPQITLAGHGVHNKLYSAMGAELVSNIKGIIDNLRKSLEQSITAKTATPTTLTGQTLVQWSPYESFDPPGAWWIKIPKDVWNKQWIYASTDEVVKSVPRTVAKETPGVGYNPPPDADAVYFPLFEPNVASGPDGDSWRAYLNKRFAVPAFRAPTKLNALTVDGKLAQGLYYRGSQTTVPVVRPKVRK